MASAGPNSPGTVASDNAVGSRGWNNPGNAVSSNNVYASCLATRFGGYSYYLRATGFGFAIPSLATIDGIKVEIERYGLANRCKDNAVSLVIGGTVSGSNYAVTGTYWPSSDAIATYGGAADKWGLTPTAENINGTDFGVVLQVLITSHSKSGASAYVDHIRITIYYTEGGSGSTFKQSRALLGVGW